MPFITSTIMTRIALAHLKEGDGHGDLGDHSEEEIEEDIERYHIKMASITLVCMFGFLLYTIVFECCAIRFISEKMGIQKNCCFLTTKGFFGF
jgi:hypothetical protein